MKERDSSRKTLVLGLGNPLSGDDRFGALVFEALQRKSPEISPGVGLVNAHTDLLNQIDNFPEYDQVVLVDAVLDPEGKLGQPGRILVLNEETLQSWPESSQSVHQLSPLLAVKLFRLMHPETRTRVTLVGLLVDRITHATRYVTDAIVREGTVAVEALLKQE